MATQKHTPAGRGFHRSLIYFHHCNDYWSSTVSNKTDGFCSFDSDVVDLWRHDNSSVGGSGGPAIPRPGGADADIYEEEIFVAEATSVIREHAAAAATSAAPLFLYYASHAPHTPMQVPQRYLDRMLGVTELSLTGQGYAAMVAVADDALGNITATLKEVGMWSETLLVFMSDNGGPIYDQNFQPSGSCPSKNRPVCLKAGDTLASENPLSRARDGVLARFGSPQL